MLSKMLHFQYCLVRQRIQYTRQSWRLLQNFTFFLLREMDVENVGFHTSPLYLAFSFGVLVSPELQKVSVFMVRQ